MHESKGQHIGKAPSLHLFHSTVRQCMGVGFLKCTASCLGMRLKPCHVCYNTIISLHWQWHALLHTSGTTYRPWAWVGCRLHGHSNQCVKLKILMHSINNYMDGSRFNSQGCCLAVVWKRCRDGALPICWPLLSCIIPTLFAYFLACHPYIFLHFLKFFIFLYILAAYPGSFSGGKEPGCMWQTWMCNHNVNKVWQHANSWKWHAKLSTMWKQGSAFIPNIHNSHIQS